MESQSIDYWKNIEFNEDEIKNSFIAESDFLILFPDYRTEYIKTHWEEITKNLRDHKLDCKLNLIKKTILVFTTEKTKDPFIILKGRDYVKLIARSVPTYKAKEIFKDDVFCEIVKLSSFVSNKERLARRRQRLVGPNESTLKSIEILTGCSVFISGQTASIIGPWKGVRKCFKLIVDCMKNIHPVYKLKELMIERELSRNPEMKDKDWTPYLPKIKKVINKKKKNLLNNVIKKK